MKRRAWLVVDLNFMAPRRPVPVCVQPTKADAETWRTEAYDGIGDIVPCFYDWPPAKRRARRGK